MEARRWTVTLLSLLLLIVVSFLGFSRITGFATSEYGNTTMSATVGAWVAITPSTAVTDGIDFGSINPGDDNNMAENDTTGPKDTNCTDYNITIDTSSNVDVDIFNDASGNLLYSGNIIGIENVTIETNQTDCGNNINMTVTSDGSVPLNTTYLIAGNTSDDAGPCKSITSGGNCYIAYWLDVPASQIAGSYETTYEYCGVQEDAGSAGCG